MAGPTFSCPNVLGPNFLYRNDGGGTFTRVGAGVLDGNSNSTAAAWGDYDNDGDLDLFVACAFDIGQESRPNLFYRNDGSNTFTRLTSLPFNDPENQGGASHGCNWADYDNDGWLDLFVANRSGQNDFLYHNNGDGTFTKVLDSIAVKDAAATWAVAWGDYDNDGYLDLFVGAFAGTNLLYHNNGNANHWLKFRLIGTRSNRAAIGAKVRVRTTISGMAAKECGLAGPASLLYPGAAGPAAPRSLLTRRMRAQGRPEACPARPLLPPPPAHS